MANSTYYVTVNRCLRRAGQPEIASTTVFDSGTLNQTQRMAKDFVDEANRMLSLDMPAYFLRKTGSITTTAVDADNDTGYSLAADCLFERLIEDSWFITTSAKGQPLEPKAYLQWLSEDPDGHTLNGRPQFWVPKEAAGAVAPYKVHFDPVPDQAYTIQYSYYLTAPVLALAADLIVWPYHIEHLLWQAVSPMLKSSMGKDAEAVFDFSQYLMPTIMKARQMILGPSELGPRANIGMKIGSTRNIGRRTAFSPD